jgi:sarcosine oxidase subunit beta
MPEDIVVGAGVYGVLVASVLARRGRQVRILEARSIASGASGGPGRRGVRANGRNLRELALMAEAYRVWPTLNDSLDVGPCYERTGHLLLLEQEQDLMSANARIQMQQSQGIDCRFLSANECSQIQPGLAQSVGGAIYCERDGVCDHEAFTRAVARQAQEHGVTIEENTQVVHIDVDGQKVTSVRTGNGRSIAVGGNLFLLANSGTAALVESAFGLKLPLWNACLQVMLTDEAPHVAINTLIGHAHRTVSIKAHGGDQVMISGGWPGHWDEASQKGHAVPESVAGNLAEAVAVLPTLDGVGIAKADASHLEAMCVDDIPIIDRLPDCANGFFAAGWSGHGWAIAPVVADLIVNWTEHNNCPKLLAPFSLQRFGTQTGRFQ